MVHRFKPLGLLTLSACLAWPGASATAAELLRSPGWLAVLPDDSQPVVPEVRAKGREWFVDANQGDDMGAGSKASPWKTLGRLKRASLSPGDVVRLKCGGVWREALDMDGKAFPPGVTVAAEERCDAQKLPSIRGADSMNVDWQADATQPGLSVADRFGAVEGLFYKGRLVRPARFPDDGGPAREFALVDGVKDTRSFRLRDRERREIGDKDLTGATVYVRVQPWQVEKSTVRSYDPSSGLVTLATDLSGPILGGTGCIFEGKRWMLSQPGEWWHDTLAKRLYLMSPDGQRPRPGDVEAVVRKHAMRINNASRLRVVGVDLRQTAQVALDVTDVQDVSFEGLSISDPGEHGAVIYRSQRVAMRGSRVERSGWHAVLTRDAPEAVVSGNLILDHGLAGRPAGSGAAIAVRGERTLVSDNQVQRAANSGIHFFNLEGTQILRNRVIRPCIRLTDCGGIQTWTGDSPSLATRKPMVRSVVKDNVVLGGASNLEGTAGRGRNQANGIYLDSMTGGVQVSGNLIAGVENGFYLHNAQFNTLTDNTLRSITRSSLTAHMSVPGGDTIRGNRIRNNRLFAKAPSSGGDEVFVFQWEQPASLAHLFTGGDANEVQDNQVLRVGGGGQPRWQVGEGQAARVISATEWRQFAKAEREQLVALTPPLPRRFGKEGENLLPDGAFKSWRANWSAYFNPVGRGGTLAAATCAEAPCLKLTTGHPSDSLSSKPFRMQSDAGRNHHVLRFTVRAGSTAGSVRVSVRRDGPPFENFGLDQPAMKLEAGEVARVELPFQATNADPARLFIGADPGMEVYLSQVSITHVAAPAAAPATAARSLFVVNLSSKPRAIECLEAQLSDCASLDEQGKPVKWPLTLAAGQGLAIFPNRSAGD